MRREWPLIPHADILEAVAHLRAEGNRSPAWTLTRWLMYRGVPDGEAVQLAWRACGIKGPPLKGAA